MPKYLLALIISFASYSALAGRPTLTVYTYSSFIADWGPGPIIKQRFESQCQCQLKFVGLEDGAALLNRIKMEGKKSKADVVLGLDNNLISQARQTGLFAESAVSNQKLKLPISWQDQTFIPYDYGYFAFVYDKKRLKNPPTSLHQLVNSSEPWRVIYQDPRTSTPGLGLMLWMQKVFAKDSDVAWQKLAKKTVTITRGWSESYSLFLKGEADLVLSYSTSPAYHMINEHKNNYAAAAFSEGHYLQIEVAARLLSSTQPQLARQFMQFISSDDFQRSLATSNWMYPATEQPLPALFSQLMVPVHALLFDPDQIAAQYKQWITHWQNAVSH